MKKKRIRAFFSDQKKLRHIIKKIIEILIVLACIFILLISYSFKIRKHYVKYTEDGKVDYKVYLNENNFFNQEYVVNENEYVTALINYINTEFKYKININEKNIDYKYRCRIEAVVDVKEKEDKDTLYNYKEDIFVGELKEISNQDVIIDEVAKVDYNKYNQMAKSFVNLYELDDAISTLTINYYVELQGNSEAFASDVNNETVFALCMPLNEKTVDIETINEEQEEKSIVYKNNSKNSWWMLVVSSILLIIAIKLLINLMKYIIKHRSAETIYNRELKKILNNYGSYIQKVNNGFDVREYTVLEVDTFNDLLEIRETIQEPIIMMENENKDEAYFMIMGRMNIIYIYYIRVSDIKIQKVNNLI